jgi:hypothetical protein
MLPIPPPAVIRRDSRVRTKTAFYKPHDIRAVTAAIRNIMDRDNPPPPIFQTTDNDQLISDTDLMRSYAIGTDLMRITLGTRRKSRRLRHSAPPIEISSSLLPKRKLTASSPRQQLYSLLHEQHLGTLRTSGTSASGKSAQPSNARERRSPPKAQLGRQDTLVCERSHLGYVRSSPAASTRIAEVMQRKVDPHRRARQVQGPRCSSRGHIASRHDQGKQRDYLFYKTSKNLKYWKNVE